MMRHDIICQRLAHTRCARLKSYSRPPPRIMSYHKLCVQYVCVRVASVPWPLLQNLHLCLHASSSYLVTLRTYTSSNTCMYLVLRWWRGWRVDIIKYRRVCVGPRTRASTVMSVDASMSTSTSMITRTNVSMCTATSMSTSMRTACRVLHCIAFAIHCD
jgi:hypothetical protein